MDRVADDMECPFDSRMEQRVMECPVLNSSRFHGATGGGPLTSGPPQWSSRPLRSLTGPQAQSSGLSQQAGMIMTLPGLFGAAALSVDPEVRAKKARALKKKLREVDGLEAKCANDLFLCFVCSLFCLFVCSLFCMFVVHCCSMLFIVVFERLAAAALCPSRSSLPPTFNPTTEVVHSTNVDGGLQQDGPPLIAVSLLSAVCCLLSVGGSLLLPQAGCGGEADRRPDQEGRGPVGHGGALRGLQLHRAYSCTGALHSYVAYSCIGALTENPHCSCKLAATQ